MIKYNCTDAEFNKVLAEKVLITDFYGDNTDKFKIYYWNQPYNDQTDVELVSPENKSVLTIESICLWEVENKKQLAVKFK